MRGDGNPKALGPDNEHPGYAGLLQGQQHVADLVSAVEKSDYWEDTLIIVTYDEHGGRWDHVTPPVTGIWGDGTRVPASIIGPLAKRRFVDHTQYNTLSILMFFFSSRRRHTRWNCDWSSDVCSSDLVIGIGMFEGSFRDLADLAFPGT